MLLFFGGLRRCRVSWINCLILANPSRFVADQEFDDIRKAAEQGFAVAQWMLGNAYYDGSGEGVVKDHVEAVKWYRKAAEQGLAEAQNNLGNAYDLGEGVA